MDEGALKLLKIMQRETYGFPYNKIIYDQDGATLQVGVLDDHFVCPFGEKHYRKIKDLPLRDDDILLVGYPKSGCHWTWEILNMIVGGKAEHTETGKLVCFLEMAPTDLIESFTDRRVLNTHLWFDYLPKQILEKKTRIIFTVRNPKDTAVSFYNHHLAWNTIMGYSGSFNNWFPLFMEGKVDYGSYFDYHLSWDKAIKNNPEHPVLIVSYEDMKEDLAREIRRLSKFVEVPLSDQQVEEFARAAEFGVMKSAYGESLSERTMRKGEVGDWKNWLTVAQSEMVEEATEEKLKETLFSSPRYKI